MVAQSPIVENETGQSVGATPVWMVDGEGRAVKGSPRTLVATPFTRPANTTQYTATGTANDLVANSTVAAEVTGLLFPLEMGETFRAERLRLRKSGPSLINASFRVYICRAQPALTVGDNAAFNNSGALGVDDINYVVGWFDVVMDRAGTAGARGVGVPNAGPAITLTAATANGLVGLIEATSNYTPISGEVFNATLEGL